MKLKQKLVAVFIAVSLLVGLVGFLGLYTNNQIVNSFKSGEEHFGSIIEASNEVSSYAKRAEGHLMLYLTLHNESDKQKFFMRLASLREQNSIMDEKVKDPEARKILDDINSKTDELQSTGESLLQAYDNEIKTKGRFEPENHQDLIRNLDDTAAEIRQDGLNLAKIEVDLRTEQDKTAQKKAANLYNIILIISASAIFGAMALGYVIAQHIAVPVTRLKEAAVDIGKGNLDTRIDIRSKDEIGELAEEFNKMAQGLKVSNDKIISAKEYTGNIVRSMTDTLVAISPDGTIQTVNPATCALLGYREDELIGKPIGVVFAGENELPFDGSKDNSLIRKEPVRNIEKNYQTKDGRKIIMSFSSSVMQDNDGKIQGIVCVAQDVTEHRRAEEQIREQASLLDKAQDAIYVRDLEHRIIYWNKSAQRLYGWTAEEVIGKEANKLLYTKEPPRLIEAKKNIIEKKEWIGELYQVTRDGKEIIVESRWTLTHDGGEKPKSILIINTDITEKKKLEAQLLRAQRMESIGTLASGIAHDINNVLSPIMLSLQLLQEKFTDDRSQKLIGIIERSAQRGASLIKQVQSFARGVEGERKALQVMYLISEIRQLAKETFPRNIEVKADISNDLWMIYGDATQLHQVIMNLCVNARDAMPDGGTLGISAENISIDESVARVNVDARVGPYVMISVSDTGTGIPANIMDRIFEPFFTTKAPGKGTGLGLSTALAIVKSHSGFINVYSEVGNGTAFKVYLPAVITAGIQQAQVQQPEVLAGHGEYILVVDDEAQIREITRAALEKNGYRVLIASDGAEAIPLYSQNRNKIKIVLMDMMMPVMDGPASVSKLREIEPQVRIIAVSGLTEGDKYANITGKVHAFLSKPYTTERLLKAIYEVLNAKHLS